MTLSRLNQIAKEQWETGAHGSKHLRVPPTLLEVLRAHWKAPTPDFPVTATLAGIPVVCDDSIGDVWRWELVDNVSRRRVEHGRVYEIESAVVDTTGDSE